MNTTDISIAIHGGAGTISRELMTPALRKEYESALKAALQSGYRLLTDGGSALDAVEAAVISLEDCPLFNAGRGSVFTAEEKHEMDASVMDGNTLNAGAVAAVQSVKNPVVLARRIMERSGHVFLCGEGAEKFAASENLAFEQPSYFFVQSRYDQLLRAKEENAVRLDHSDKKFGTVGAVARDVRGNLAAATSTGGMTNKRYGRVGDTPVIGSGTYANNRSCAVSCTGHGEFFIRAIVAYDISCLVEYKGMSLSGACSKVVNEKLIQLGGEGGVIAIAQHGPPVAIFNSDGMYRGWIAEGRESVAVFREDSQ